MRRTRGFSLLELIVYMGILSLVSVILTSSFFALSTGRAKSEARSEVDASMRFAMTRILQDIKSASAVIAPTTGTSTTLSLQVGSDTVVYGASVGQLQRTLNATPAERLTGSAVVLQQLLFTRSDNYNSVLAATTTTIQVDLTLRYNASSPEWSYASSVRGSATLR